MKTFKQYIFESGEKAGNFEVDKISIEDAVKYANKVFGEPVENIIPNFEGNFKKAQKLDKIGKTSRKEMPVIEDYQVKALQRKLAHGSIDVNKPYADNDDPFPEGLTGKQAEEFLLKGFHDKKLKDDVIKVQKFTSSSSSLKPIQKQIYLDKCLDATAQFGIDGTKKFLTSSLMIKSSDDFIIDGHHRWMSSLLIDPNIKLTGISIDLGINKLLPMLKAYGDAIGNKRNR